MTIKGEKTMNRLSLIRYTSAVALGLSHPVVRRRLRR